MVGSAIVAFLEERIRNRCLVAAILAVVPVTELKGAVLYAAAAGGSVWLCALAAYLATIPLCFVLSRFAPRSLGMMERIPFLRRRTAFLTDRLTERAERMITRAEKKGEGVSGSLLFGVYAFVALPLPMTGVWAGALLSALLHLDGRRTFFALAAGNFTAGGITLAVGLLAGEKAGLVFDGFLLVALALLLYSIVKGLVKRRRKARRAG